MGPLSEPRLLLDEAKARRNLARMAARAHKAGVRLRPHFKTHQSQEIGRWFRDYGVEAITVSSLSMAEYFAADGWRDITLAFPYHRGMHERAQALAAKLAFGITIADFDALDGLRFDHPVDVWLKIDVGNHRTGFEPEDLPALRKLAAELARRDDLRLRGLLAHAGHSYAARSPEQIAKVHRNSLDVVHALSEQLADVAGPLALSIGDTPGCSTQADYPGIDEIRPGNFIFYDLSQWQIGSCAIDDIAVAMACPVVSRHPRRGQLVVHGGAVHFSKDSIELDGQRVFGVAVTPEGNGWGALIPEVRLVSLSQEHGIVEAPAEFIERPCPGDALFFLPVHSCLTVDAMGSCHMPEGKSVATIRARFSS
ncbi:MAG TPA: alanine racemase [Xanthomonadaceae bacterium]|nr:alanine racemase [Xanthomonadaceae bacterium]